MEDKDLFQKLFAKKWKDPMALVKDIANDIDHIFWGCARDFAKEILSKTPHWYWVVYYIDDYAPLVEDNIQLKKWIKWAEEGKGSLNCHLTDTQTLIRWLLDRYVNQFKNLFDVRYKNHIKAIKFIYLDENKY